MRVIIVLGLMLLTGEAYGNEIDRACVKRFMSPTDQRQCMRYAQSVRHVHMCVDAFFFDSDSILCLREGRSLKMIRACKRSFFYESDRRRCLVDGIGPRMVEACYSVFKRNYPSHALGCSMRARNHRAVRLCRDFVDNYKDQYQCTKLARNTVQIKDCAEAYTEAADRIACLEKTR